MLTLITGTPGAGKSLYAVWHFAKPVPGSVIEDKQQSVPRRLLSNVKDLLVEHEKIDADNLNNWHTWARPGDVILFDEVQEVWRPRAFGSKVPDCIAALETHRHMGVDIILVTQHPMLVDPNIRRLVNQHLHLRRITKTVAYVYEWDHCENPGNTKTCVASRPWMHPKKAYGLYKSAQLHTKPTVRVPAIAFVGIAALCGLAYAGPIAYQRITGHLGASKPAETVKPSNTTVEYRDGKQITTVVEPSVPAALPPVSPSSAPSSPDLAEGFAGCISVGPRCSCYSGAGKRVETTSEFCADNSASRGQAIVLAGS